MSSASEDEQSQAPDEAATMFAKDQVIGPPDSETTETPLPRGPVSSETIEITPAEEGSTEPAPTIPGSYVNTREEHGRHKRSS